MLNAYLESHSSLSLAENPLYEDNIDGDSIFERRNVKNVEAIPTIPAPKNPFFTYQLILGALFRRISK